MSELKFYIKLLFCQKIKNKNEFNLNFTVLIKSTDEFQQNKLIERKYLMYDVIWHN